MSISQFYCAMHKLGRSIKIDLSEVIRLGIFSRHVGDALHSASTGVSVQSIRKGKSRFSEYQDEVYPWIKHVYELFKSDTEKRYYFERFQCSLGLKKCSAIRFITFDTNAAKIYPNLRLLNEYLEERSPKLCEVGYGV